MYVWEAGGGEQWLLCTPLRTWLDGPTPLSPGTWQGACSVMSLTTRPPPPALCSEEVWHVVSPSERLRRAGERAVQGRVPPAITQRGTDTLASDPGRWFPYFSMEVMTLAKERLGHPKSRARRGGAAASDGGPPGGHHELRDFTEVSCFISEVDVNLAFTAVLQLCYF